MMNFKLRSFALVMVIAIFCIVVQSSNPSTPANADPKLPPHMRSVQLPHTFTAFEMDAIRMRLRSFLLELQTFAAATPMMLQDQLQMNYAQSVWPMMRCLVANQDSRCPGP